MSQKIKSGFKKAKSIKMSENKIACMELVISHAAKIDSGSTMDPLLTDGPCHAIVPTWTFALVFDKIYTRVVAVDSWVSQSPQACLRFLEAPLPTCIVSYVIGLLNSCQICMTLFFVFPQLVASDSKPLFLLLKLPQEIML
jgi:hypothetical protein